MKLSAEVAIYKKNAVQDAVDDASTKATHYLKYDTTTGKLIIAGDVEKASEQTSIEIDPDSEDPCVKIKIGENIYAKYGTVTIIGDSENGKDYITIGSNEISFTQKEQKVFDVSTEDTEAYETDYAYVQVEANKSYSFDWYKSGAITVELYKTNQIIGVTPTYTINWTENDTNEKSYDMHFTFTRTETETDNGAEYSYKFTNLESTYYYLKIKLYRETGKSPHYSFGLRKLSEATKKGAYSTVIGVDNSAEGTASVSVGQDNEAKSHRSIAVGRWNTVNSQDSVAIGTGLNVSGMQSVVFGRYNKDDTNDLYSFIIGNGSENGSRHNAVEIEHGGDTDYGNTYLNDEVFFTRKAHLQYKYLWSGALYMTANHIINLSEPISEQNIGIVLIWSEYKNNAPSNSQLSYFFVPKVVGTDTWLNGKGVNCSSLSPFSSNTMRKYVYVSDTQIIGHVNNDNTSYADNKNYVLRAVIGV